MNAVIYARYSSNAQTEQSIEGQLRDNYAWAEQQGITVVGEYIDRALSGTKDTRPSFQRMIDDSSKRQFEMVIVWKLDRFARNRYDSAIYKARLKKHGVRVVSVKENITDSPEGIILEGMLESMAEYYSANLAQNVRRGLRESIAKGNYCGGTVPYGYKLEGKKLVVDEMYAPMIRYMFERYAAGDGKAKIIAELNRRGYRTRRHKTLTIGSMNSILKNTAYVGRYVYSGQVIQGLSQPIISEELFQNVQQRLKAVARAPAAAKAKVSYLLQGKIFCGHCGASMVGESGRSHTGSVYQYYACYNKKRKHCCHKKNERKDFVEWYVVEQTLQYILTPQRVRIVAAAVAEEYKREFSGSRIDQLERAIDQLDHELDRLVDALLETPKAARGKINERIEAIGAQKEEMELDLARLRVASKIQLTESEVRAWLHTFTRGDPSDEAFRRRIIDAFINSIYMYDDRIIIFYNIRGGKQVSYIDLASSDVAPEPDPPESPPALSGSDLISDGRPETFKSEPRFVFVNGVFGCVFCINRSTK